MKFRKSFSVLLVCMAMLSSTGCGTQSESSISVSEITIPTSEAQTVPVPETAELSSGNESAPSEAMIADTIPPTADFPSENTMNDNLVSEVLTADTLPETSEVITAELITERPLSGIKIGIDPGHQQNANYDMEAVAPGSSETKYKVNSGTDGTATSIPEYVTNLEISLLLRDKLEAQGATVYMTRETHDVDISNQERAIMMNEYGVDLALRIHCDSADDPNAHGLALYVSESNSIADQSYHYAEIILPIASGIMGAKANGIIQNDNYTGQNWSEVPCMMVECGFMSNPEEDILLNTPEYQEKICDGLTEGIIACFAP